MPLQLSMSNQALLAPVLPTRLPLRTEICLVSFVNSVLLTYTLTYMYVYMHSDTHTSVLFFYRLLSVGLAGNGGTFDSYHSHDVIC